MHTVRHPDERQGKADLTKELANRVLNAAAAPAPAKNPQTGEPVKIKSSNTVEFKPSKSLKDSGHP
jgi:hypothetical protein